MKYYNLYLLILSLIVLNGNLSGQATFKLEGDIQIASSNNNNPQSGTLRWNPNTNDFEGYNGSDWMSLTQSGNSMGTWGQPNPFNYEDQGIIASNGIASDNFGESTAAFGSRFAIGAEESNGGSGTVYLYNDSVQELDIITVQGAGSLGEQLEMTAEWLAIGADDGFTYLYELSSKNIEKIETQKSPTGMGLSQFISIDDNLLVVRGLDSCLYTFRYETDEWVELEPLCLTGASNLFNVAISNQRLAFKASGQEKVTIFQLNGSKWEDTGNAILPPAGYSLGFTSFDNNQLSLTNIVDNFQATTPVQTRGFVSIYEFQNGNLVKTEDLELSRCPVPGASKLKGDIMTVSSCQLGSDPEESLFNGQGMITVFEKSNNGNWQEVSVLTASDGRNGDIFGWDHDIGDGFIIVGALWADINPGFINESVQQGKGYLFRR